MGGDADKSRRRHRALSEEERILWSTVTGGIAPLRRPPPTRDPEPAETSPPVPAPPTSSPPAKIPVAAKPSAPALAPIDRRLKQRLARGTEPIDARVDLHGLTQVEAHDLLVRFLHAAAARGARFVLVITGKGTARDAASEGERGVLRRQVPLWLKAPRLRDTVVGFSAAHVGHGGEGALYVRLRRRHRNQDD